MFISSISIVGSLFFSEYLQLPPCNLCWYQRIFIYPIPFITIVAYRIKDYSFRLYTGILSLVGLIFSGYHVYVQSNQEKSIFCSISIEDCSTIELEIFGFITIPMLSFLAFLGIFIVSILKENN